MVEPLPLTPERALAYRDAAADRGAVALVAVLPPEPLDGIGGALGVAVANESGYHPVPLGWARYASLDAASAHADALNESALGLDAETAFRIIASTMGGRRYVAGAA